MSASSLPISQTRHSAIGPARPNEGTAKLAALYLVWVESCLSASAPLARAADVQRRPVLTAVRPWTNPLAREVKPAVCEQNLAGNIIGRNQREFT